jgi:radical SAM superfamily enzyme YgiQ (UPF0313 family)
MVGLDSDDLSVFDRLSDFIINSHLYHSSITILTPVYGTRLRDRLLKENRLLPTNWDNYTGYNVNFIPQKMSTQELEEGLTALYKKVYNENVFLGTMEYFKKIQKNLLLKGN